MTLTPFGYLRQDEALEALGIPDAADPVLAGIAALSWAGNALKVIRVNATEDGWELAAIVLGTAAAKDVGTSGDAVPLLNAANTWSASQIVQLDQDAATLVSVRNPNAGTAASAQIEMRNGALGNNDRLLLGAYGAGYTGIASWQDAGVVSARSSLSGGLVLAVGSATQSIKVQIGDGTVEATFDSTGLNLASGDSYRINGQQVVGARGAALPADATDLASAIALVNAIKARIKTTGGHGLVAD